MHKTRRFLPPLPDFLPGSYDLHNPKLRLISVPRENLKITYNFEALCQPILDAVTKSSGQHFSAPDGHVVVPVHELQLLHIEAKFPDAIIYPAQFSLPLLAQQSLRYTSYVFLRHCYSVFCLDQFLSQMHTAISTSNLESVSSSPLQCELYPLSQHISDLDSPPRLCPFWHWIPTLSPSPRSWPAWCTLTQMGKSQSIVLQLFENLLRVRVRNGKNV